MTQASIIKGIVPKPIKKGKAVPKIGGKRGSPVTSGGTKKPRRPDMGIA